MRVDEPPALSMERGRVRLGNNVILDGVDFQLRASEFVVLLGANGSGKSTLVRSLLGLVPLAEGRTAIFGEPVERFRGWDRIGYVPQRTTAATGVPATVEEVVLSGRVARSTRWGGFRPADRVAAAAAIEAVGLNDHARVSVAALSGGQQQRVLIARALATDPDVLVLDEPISGVDLENQASFAATLKGLNESGRAVLLVAHGLGVLGPLVQRAVVLQAGRVAYDGAPRPEDLHTPHVHHHPELRPEFPTFGRVGGSS